MKALRLKKEVTVEGPDFWGRNAWITFTPTMERGWFWMPDNTKEPIPITPDIVVHHKNHLTLSAHARTLHVYEHIGVLRFLGIDGVVIESTSWPPYHGRALELWTALTENCEITEEEILWCVIQKSVGWQYPNTKQKTKQKRFTFIRPRYKELCVQIVIAYPGLGHKKLVVQLPRDREILLQALAAYSQGWPPKRYTISRLVSLIGWPHHNKVTWPQEHSTEKTLELFILHRLVDILGAFSLAHNTHLLAGTITSECSGHEADLRTIQSLEVRPVA